MIPGEAVPQVFLPGLITYSFTGSQQLTLNIERLFFHTVTYPCHPFRGNAPLKFSFQIVNEERIAHCIMTQLMQKRAVNHYSKTNQTFYFFNIKTLQV